MRLHAKSTLLRPYEKNVRPLLYKMSVRYFIPLDLFGEKKTLKDVNICLIVIIYKCGHCSSEKNIYFYINAKIRDRMM